MKLNIFLSKKGRGAVAGLARGINAHGPDVSRWANGKRPCPPPRCLEIEKYTGGAVTRKDLRPNDYKRIWPELAD